jgi:TonB family protein
MTETLPRSFTISTAAHALVVAAGLVVASRMPSSAAHRIFTVPAAVMEIPVEVERPRPPPVVAPPPPPPPTPSPTPRAASAPRAPSAPTPAPTVTPVAPAAPAAPAPVLTAEGGDPSMAASSQGSAAPTAVIAPGPPAQVTATPTPTVAAPGPIFDPGSYLEGVTERVRRHRNYPAIAQEMGLEGTVEVRVVVAPDGTLASPPTIDESCGHEVLDDEALRIVRRAAPFPPLVGLALRAPRARAQVPPAAPSVLGREDLATRAAERRRRAAHRARRLNVASEDGMGLRLNIGVRGLDPNRSRKVLVLEDGMPVSLNPYGSPELYYTPPIERMDRVEVVRGSGQILWGPQTIGGVINYITRDPPRAPAGASTCATATTATSSPAPTPGRRTGRSGGRSTRSTAATTGRGASTSTSPTSRSGCAPALAAVDPAGEVQPLHESRAATYLGPRRRSSPATRRSTSPATTASRCSATPSRSRTSTRFALAPGAHQTCTPTRPTARGGGRSTTARTPARTTSARATRGPLRRRRRPGRDAHNDGGASVLPAHARRFATGVRRGGLRAPAHLGWATRATPSRRAHGGPRASHYETPTTSASSRLPHGARSALPSTTSTAGATPSPPPCRPLHLRRAAHVTPGVRVEGFWSDR